jgi:hypothetical protein
MRKLTLEERIRLVPVGKNAGSSPVRKHAFELAVGDMIFLPKNEWKKYKYSARTTIGSLLYHKEKKFSAKQHSLDKIKGYVIERVK